MIDWSKIACKSPTNAQMVVIIQNSIAVSTMGEQVGINNRNVVRAPIGDLIEALAFYKRAAAQDDGRGTKTFIQIGPVV